MAKRHEIRNSTAEFLIFQIENKEQGVEVYYKDENIWATQKAISGSASIWVVKFVCQQDFLLLAINILRRLHSLGKAAPLNNPG